MFDPCGFTPRTAIMPGCTDRLASAHYYREWRGFDNHGYRGSVQSSMLGPGASPGNGWAGARPVGSAAGVIRRHGRMSEAPAEFQV